MPIFALKSINVYWIVQSKNMVHLSIYLGFLLYIMIKLNSSLSTSLVHSLVDLLLSSLHFCFHCKCNHFLECFPFHLIISNKKFKNYRRIKTNSLVTYSANPPSSHQQEHLWRVGLITIKTISMLSGIQWVFGLLCFI